MQVTNTFGKGALPPVGGGVPPTDIASQLRQQRSYYQRIHFQRSLRFWWFRILFIVLAVALSVTVGYIYSLFPLATVLASYKYIVVAAIAFPLVVFLVRHLDIALLFMAIAATPFLPQAFTLKSLQVFPCILLVVLLFCTLLVQVSFHIRKAFLPSLWVLWPYIGMVVLALVSTLMVQFTWTHGVPKKINNNPIYYDEILAIGIYFFPILTYMAVTTVLSSWEKLIQWILNAFLLAAFGATIVTFIEFRRVGGNISTFRFSDPHIFWMSLRGLAQLMVLGANISYIRFLYPLPWRGRTRLPRILQNLFLVAVPFSYGTSVFGVILIRTFFRRVFRTGEFYVSAGKMRTLYAVLTILQVVAIIVTLQNSWWVELFVGLLIVTIIVSFRLLLFYFSLLLPFVPLLKLALDKLQSLKADDYLRLIIWQDALRVWSKQPMLGVGPGDFWAYDQIYTKLPRIYRNCNATGLCVAHNGYLQTLGELGPLGLFFYIAATVVVIIIAVQLLRRTKLVKLRKDNLLNSFLQWLGLYEYDNVEQRNDRVLALVGIGLACGSMAADFFIGEFMLPPRQVSAFNVIPQVMVSWIVYSLVMYKHKLWLTGRRALRIAPRKKLPDLIKQA